MTGGDDDYTVAYQCLLSFGISPVDYAKYNTRERAVMRAALELKVEADERQRKEMEKKSKSRGKRR